MDTLTCPHCGETKPDEDFYRQPRNTGRRGRSSWCKLCTKAQTRDRKRGNREAYKGDPAYHRDWSLKTKYGLTSVEVEAMLEAQGGCAICGTQDPGWRKGWHVDHDHETGAVRGVLCNGCNTGIGHLGDNEGRVWKAYTYLAWHSFQQDMADDPDFDGGRLTGGPPAWFLAEVL